MDNQRREAGRSGRYVPFNLSTVAPFESTAQALGELPTTQVLCPSSAIDAHPQIRENRYSPSEEVQARMVEMMHESALQGSWTLRPDEIAMATADVPRWVLDTCQFFSNMSIAEIGKTPSSRRTIPKRPRNSAQSTRSPTASEVYAGCNGSSGKAVEQNHTPSLERRTAYHTDIDEQVELRREKLEAQAAEHFEDENFAKFISCLQRFIGKRKGPSSTGSEYEALKMTSNPKLLSDIRENVTIHMQNNLLPKVPPALLSELMKSLTVRVRHACNLCKTYDPSISTTTVFAECILATQCSIIILTIFGAPNISRTVLVEEFLDDAAAFLGLVCNNVVYPSVDPLFRASKLKEGGRSSRGGKSEDHTNNEHGNNGDSKKWTCKHNGGASIAPKKMQSLIVFCATIFDLLAALVLDRRLSESVAFKVSCVGMRSLRATSIGLIHSSAVSFVATTYAFHPDLGSSILNDLLDEIGYMPPARKHLRTFRVIGAETTSIRISSAMALQIVQLATSAVDPRGDSYQQSVAQTKGLDLRPGYEHATRFAMHLVNAVLKRAFQERDSEYRTAVQAFLDDIMVMYSIPEWPGADIVLQCFSVQIVNSLETTGKGKLSAYARALAMDYLGALASRMSSLLGSAVLKASNLSEHVSSDCLPETLTSNRVQLLRFFEEEYCGNGKHNPSQGLWEAMFFTDDLFAARKSKEGKHRRKKSRQDSDEDSSSSESEPESVCTEDRAVFFAEEQRSARTEALSAAKRNGGLSTRPDAIEAAKAITAQRGLSLGFPTILEAIFFGLQDPAPTVRTKAVRGLSHMKFDKDLILLHLPNVFSVMENSCRDISTLVREAALDFLGRFLSLETNQGSPQRDGFANGTQSNVSAIFRKVFSIVDKRLKDSATSVRKRAINIFRKLAVEILSPGDSEKPDDDLMEPEASHQFRENLIVRICTSLVGRLDDPETTVRDVAEKTVRYSLFGVESGETPRRNNVEESARRSTRRLISLFIRLPWNSQQSFLQRAVHKPMMKNNMPLLVAIISSTVDHLHELESRLADGEANGVPFEKIGETSANQIYERERVACAAILGGFCLVQPSLVAAHCSALAPSLTGFVERRASESDILCTQHMLKVLECGIPHMDGLEPALLEDITRDVEVIVCQYPSPVLEEPSVRCLCALALHANSDESRELLMNTANTFHSFLLEQLPALRSLSNGQRSASRVGLERNSRGALVRLSLLLRYGDFSDEFVTTVYNGLKAVCSILLKDWSDNSVQFLGSPTLLRASVRALIHFLIRHRSFLPLGTTTILDFTTKALKRMSKFGEADQHATDILLTVFQGFHEMLRNEEERNSTPRGVEPAKKSRFKIVNSDSEQTPKQPSLGAEEDAEAGYLAVCAQSLVSSLSAASVCHELSVRRVVANILGLLTRQGLVLPATIVSPLFSLLIDTDIKSREDSYRVIAFIADRHSSMLASAALPAIRNCFRQTALRLAEQPSELSAVQRITASILDSKSGYTLLSPVMTLLSRDYRQGILEGLLREFDPCVSARVKAVNATSHISELETVPMDAQMEDACAPDDDDMLEYGSRELELYSTKKLCPVSTLAFVSITLACMDYSNGAGLGGAMKQGGGTAAADAKLKAGRDDITEICGIATRIISNSGQAVLRVAVQRMKMGSFAAKEKSLIADHAVRLCILLRLKNHLRNLRGSGAQQTADIDDETDLDAIRTAPPFSLEELPLTAGPLCKDTLLRTSTDADWMKQIVLFRKMMREDAIDGCDVTVKQSRSRNLRKFGRSGKRPRAKRVASGSGRVKKPKHSRLERGPRKRIRLADEDSDDGSDYMPN